MARTDNKQKNKSTRESATFQLQLEQLLLGSISRIVNFDDLDSAISKSFVEIGKFLQADKIELWSYDVTTKCVSILNEWNNKGVKSTAADYQAIKFSDKSINGFVDTVNKGSSLYCSDISGLPRTRTKLKNYCADRDISSIVLLPVVIDKKAVACLTIINPVKMDNIDDPDITGLNIFANALHTVIRKKQNEIEQKRHETLHRQAQKIVQLGYWEWDEVNERLMSCSDQLAEMYGVTPDELLNEFDSLESELNWIHEEDRDRYKLETDTATEDQRGVDIEYRILTRSGEIRHVRELSEFITDDKGNKLRSFGTMQDITDIQQEEDRLHFQIELQQLVHGIYAKIAISDDLDNAITDAMGELGSLTASERVSLWKLAADHSMGSKTHEWCAPGIESQFEMFQNFPREKIEFLGVFEKLTAGEPFYIENIYRLLPDQKDIRDFFENIGIHSVLVLPIMDDDLVVSFYTLNNPARLNQQSNPNISLLKIFGDSLHFAVRRYQARTELIAAKEAAEQASEIANTTLRNMGQAIVMVDAKGKLLVYNDIFLDDINLTAAEAAEFDTFEEVIRTRYPDDKEGFTRSMEIAEAGQYTVYEATTPTGRVVEIRHNPMAEGGFVRTYTDVTALKLAQNKLLEAKETAEQAARAKASFLATMSHEIRTPMTGVIGMVDLLHQTTLDDEQKLMLNTIATSGESLLAIINDILDFSKIEAGKLELEFIPISPMELVETSAQTIATTAREKNLRLLTFVDPALPDLILGDPVRIKQILINLLGNAIKFSDSGNVVINAMKQDERIVFSVIDQGIGIPEQIQKELFHSFTQADTSTTRNYGGTGLGLTISKRLTDLMDGDIEMHSKVGKGSRFSLELPLQAASSHSNEDKNILQGLRILLANNNEEETRIISSYLESFQAQVTTCDHIKHCSGLCSEAVHNNNGFDVVIIGPAWDRVEQLKTRDKLAQSPGLDEITYVFLVKGRRQRVRPSSDDIVFLDVDPMRRNSLISSVAIAAGLASPEVFFDAVRDEAITVVPAPSVDEAREQGVLVLVAEDNPINRDVISRQLSQLGYAFIMVEDGQQALAALARDTFALVLTDCHMPVMDGFELTNAIRKQEKDTDSHIPIIAITANTLAGEAERCIASGMDDYLAKPVLMRELRAVMQHWLPGAVEQEQQLSESINIPSQELANQQVINIAVLSDMIGNDREALTSMLDSFIGPLWETIGELNTAVDARNADNVNESSHKLKSSALVIGAERMATLAQILETAGADKNWDLIYNRYNDINEYMVEVEGWIKNYSKQ